MQLTQDDSQPDEKFSTHVVQAFSTEKCPFLVKDRPCFGIATGFGGALVNTCEFFLTVNEDIAECLYTTETKES